MGGGQHIGGGHHLVDRDDQTDEKAATAACEVDADSAAMKWR
jgi:hypothetical protein